MRRTCGSGRGTLALHAWLRQSRRGMTGQLHTCWEPGNSHTQSLDSTSSTSGQSRNMVRPTLLHDWQLQGQEGGHITGTAVVRGSQDGGCRQRGSSACSGMYQPHVPAAHVHVPAARGNRSSCRRRAYPSIEWLVHTPCRQADREGRSRGRVRQACADRPAAGRRPRPRHGMQGPALGRERPHLQSAPHVPQPAPSHQQPPSRRMW